MKCIYCEREISDKGNNHIYNCGKKLGFSKNKIALDIIYNKIQNTQIITKENLYYYYIELEYSIREMCNLTNLSRKNIIILLNFYKINIRNIKQCSSTNRQKNIRKKAKLLSYKNNKQQILNKRKKTNLQRYGVQNNSQSKQNKLNVYNTWKSKNDEQINKIINKRSVTNLQKFGVKNVFQSQQIKNKIKQTCLKKYGTINPSQSQQIKNKIKQTNLQKYGCICSLNNQQVIKKANKTKLIKYGTIYHQRVPEIIKKQVKTYKLNCLKKYGVDHPIKSSKFSGRFNTYVKHDYILPSNKIIQLQGYQNKTMDQLLQTYKQQDILYERKDMPFIQYYNMLDDKYHRYFPDFFIPKQNLIIETKSKYTLKKDAFKNCLKINAVFNNGYNFKIYIY